MPKLIPAILEKTEKEVRKKIEILKTLGMDMAHLDVIDGSAVENSCWGIPEIASTFDIKLEVHLMVRNPLDEALKWLALKKKVARVIVRGEEVFNWQEFSDLSKNYPGKLGMAFDPESLFWKHLQPECCFEFLLIMGVMSGASGQKFKKEETLNNIVMATLQQPLATIGVDGGMNEVTIPLVKQFGVKTINTASYFWNSPDKKKIIEFVEKE